MIKRFKVASVSENCNAFGLRGMILVAKDGEAWRVAANSLNLKPIGTVLQVPYLNRPTWAGFGFEIPERFDPGPPPEAVEEVWTKIPIPN